MTRPERNEFNYIRRSLKKAPGYGATLTIRTNAGSEYKKALHDFYTSLDFHPAAVTTDPRRFDSNERILYIKGLEEGGIHWTSLYTQEEQALFARKLT